MSRDLLLDEAPLEGIDQLVDYFRLGAKTDSNLGIGTEHEKFLFSRPGHERLAFDGPRGIEELLERLAQRFDYERQFDQGRLVALVRNGEAITLEPGGQFELSGAVTQTIFETRDEFDRHIAELAEVCGPQVASVSFGLDPFDGLAATDWVPKSRYAVMSRYLATRGGLAHWMMKGTCTIQANLDYQSEADAVDIVHTATLLSPIVNALFANSPIRERADTGMQSFRAQIWTDTDPDRCGVPDFMLHDEWGFEEWANWVLDVPLFFLRRESGYIDLAGRSFRALMAGEIDGLVATMGDFELHLSTVFPEVRLKRFVEVRSADGGSRDHVLALPALWKGITYDLQARREARELVLPGYGPLATRREAHSELYRVAATDGIHGSWRGRSIREIAASLLSIARAGLDRLAAKDHHPTEAVFLAPLDAITANAVTAADQLRADFAANEGDRDAIISSRNLLRG